MPFLKVIKNEAGNDPVEIMCYGQIGKDWYDDSGIAAKEFNDFLATIPKEKPVLMRLNSGGGNIWEGVAIGDRIAARGNVTCIVEGIAASIASYIAMSAKVTQITRGASIMIHRASSFASGNADDMATMKARLDAHDEMLASFYASKTGKSVKDCQALMDKESWMFGQAAVDEGFADEFIDVDAGAQNSLSTLDLTRFRNIPDALKSVTAKAGTATPKNNTQHTMPLTKLKAMLTKRGVKVADDATEETILAELEKVTNAAPAAAATSTAATDANAASILNAINARLEASEKRERALRKVQITAQVDAAIADDRLPLAQRDRWIARAEADETVLNDIQALQPRPPGVAPLASEITVITASFEDIQKEYKRLTSPLNAMRENRMDGLSREIGEGSKGIARLCNQLRKRFPRDPNDGESLVCAPILNANTVSTDLKRQVIMSEAMRDFKRVIYPLSVFSTKFERVPLEGLDTVIVPYYPLSTTASQDFVQGTGYVTPNATSTNSKSITINKRKYQFLQFNASEIARQPWLNIQKEMLLAAEQLAIDVFSDFGSLFTAANYGAAIKIIPFAGFDRDAIVDLRTAVGKLNWPQTMRNLMLNFDYSGNLLKDPGLVNVLNVGTDQALRAANLGQMFGFQAIHESNYIPANAENLVGYVVHPASACFATSPIMPAPGERKLMVNYDVVVDEQTDVSFEYKYFGDPIQSRDNAIIECNYGYAKANTDGLRRITSA